MRVQFLKDTSMAVFPQEINRADTLVVYREGYALPTLTEATYVDFEQYKASYTNYNPANIIMVGTNRIFIPQIRCELVFQYLQTMTPHIIKYSVDTEPFIGEPWRLWFHYSLAFGRWLGVTYSYAVETDWLHWFFRDSEESIMQASKLKPNIADMHSDLDVLYQNTELYTPNAELVQFYEEVKDDAFSRYQTPKLIINYMLRELNKHLGISYGMDSYKTTNRCSIPDFGIYRFIAQENDRRRDIYNCFTK